MNSIITTEKDYVKLPLSFIKKVDIYILCMNVNINDSDRLIISITNNINKFKQR